MAATATTEYTVDDLDWLRDEIGVAHLELDPWGSLIVSPASDDHEIAQGALASQASRQLNPAYPVVPSFPWTVSAGTGYLGVPDLIILAPEWRRVGESGVDPPPLLVVEIASPSTRRADRGRKLADYRLGGAGLYLMVDLPATFELHDFAAGIVTTATGSIDMVVGGQPLHSGSEARPPWQASAMGAWRRWAGLGALAVTLAGCGGGGSGGGDSDSGRAGAAGKFSIALWGDTPYTPGEAIAVPKLIDQINASDVAFTVFIGDLQGGGRCDNAIYTDARDRFGSFVKPMVYTPGDNEWTDCHVTAQDPIERLGYLRRTMFPTDRSFGQQTVTVQQQLQYPENARWTSHGVQFVTLDVPGSNDNHIGDPDADERNTPRGPAERRAAEAEYRARDQADRDWLHQGFAAATASGAPAVVVAMQADPLFEIPAADRAAQRVDGFDPLLTALAVEAKGFGKPVVVLHGDSHRYRTDTPLVDLATGRPVTNVTRIETFGSPNVGWVRVTFDPASPAFVSAEPHAVLTG